MRRSRRQPARGSRRPRSRSAAFYLLEASSLDEAVKLASMLPEVQASHSEVEIRPVVDHGVRWPAAHPDGG
ncbi:MAG TPA: hypothetical protein VFV73_45220 [Streptosporangiaceae bacterium]|nr:hypothetical protein [Streptosporangiaceae bacterium]